MRAIRRFTVRPVLPDALASLGELAANLRWSWHPPTQALFEAVDPELWQAVGHDPVRLLGEVGGERWAELAADESYVRRAADLRDDLTSYLTQDRWYQRARAAEPDATWPASVAYFSPEFGITAVLPQYSGGLGILAGDHLKAASDLGVPIVGVGLLYRHGYFKQALSHEGWQQESYPVLDPDGLPLSLLHENDGTRATISIRMPDGPDLLARIWVASVGRVPLLLLDTDFEENPEPYRLITDRLYGGNTEHRLRQELLLGVGGVRALRVHARITGAPEPEVFHTNEGHAGFLGVERIRELTADSDLDFATALEAGRASTVFTTHTPVPAGIDRFPRSLVEQYLGDHGATPGVPVDQVLALGAEDYDGGDPGVFNMAVMGFRLAQRANGVSQLHGHVSRGMFNGLWPAFDEAEVPITSITNGVHAPTWVAPEVAALAEAQGADYDGDDADAFWSAFAKVPGPDVWRTKRALRERLVDDARRRLRKSWEKRGAAPAELGWIDEALDPDVLTIGFARRVPSYKRLTLMLRDPERLKALLLHPERPVQLVVAGKAHPADDGGKRLIQELVRFADAEDVRHRIVFLPNYDIALALPLYPGCDVWLNNPLRPYEACGTSGMKAALNGGLNLSILDGWWDEWYEPEFGWPIPSADSPLLAHDPDKRDDLEAAALYDLIETEVAPRFYDLDHEGVPGRWIEMLRHTWASLGPKVLATRMVRDYVAQLYAPAARNARALAAVPDGARDLAHWKARVRSAWDGVRVEHVEAAGVGDAAEVGAVLRVHSYIALGELAPSDVEVQLVHGPVDAEDDIVASEIVPLRLVESYDGGRHRFDGEVSLSRPGPFGYTVRVLPANPLLVAPAELGVVALA
ncbi:alpha-glucan family phosphorylase [Pimelobacter simplex]|uniref:glycogen phosphorylase n=1 Tax=Nocardioides simplex TaxID=2045 RepID=A0A0A1DNG3_NOCSI|nr:alpha-glucan family phosphorylase [Pimelobacter simplex]AIY18177.1 Glycogen phosphorylase [Pimelobacter simplex]MCG8153567.1 alpha-glucan family phosphorylase [Pimelobacter simplex]GEB15765.1 alpha-1,4 glucan phosphorylase [Pimelobacter simplex]SFN10503.1 starch phosphorylase [Pimelobacter simplex]